MSDSLGPWDESWGPWLTPADCIGPEFIVLGMWYTSPIATKGKGGEQCKTGHDSSKSTAADASASAGPN